MNEIRWWYWAWREEDLIFFFFFCGVLLISLLERSNNIFLSSLGDFMEWNDRKWINMKYIYLLVISILIYNRKEKEKKKEARKKKWLREEKKSKKLLAFQWKKVFFLFLSFFEEKTKLSSIISDSINLILFKCTSYLTKKSLIKFTGKNTNNIVSSIDACL